MIFMHNVEIEDIKRFKMLRAVFIVSCVLAVCSGAALPRPMFKRHVSEEPKGMEDTPYVVAVEAFFGTINLLMKTAVLITPNFGVTNSFTGKGFDYFVRVGSSLSGSGGTVVPIKRIITHPQYINDNYYDLDYDLALIEFESPVELSDNVQTIALAEEDPPAGQYAVYIGWNRVNPQNVSDESEVLKYSHIPVGDRQECIETYTDSTATRGPISNRQICVPAAGTEACKYSTRGPLIVDNKLTAVFSWGWSCGFPEKPDVLSSVVDEDMRRFIRDYTGL